ncbi:hypothetical protein [Saccharothrix luteola]|uniref:hypothetical protein n=1 Tax=Saccharothrix luteola TaxID=2893018 RepID=UPI001E413C51|nr:hypothetical protein [Saccharothrix luteola]MCC8251138.1 hypothetical protein [Saccharothrix luteola]
MSYQPQRPQHRPQPPYPQPQFPPPHHPQPPAQWTGAPTGPPKKRTGRLVAVIIVVLVVLGGAGGVWFRQSGGGSSAVGEDLPKNSALGQLAFPDLGALRHGEGVDALCGALEGAMTGRGYRPISRAETEGGINCRFITPGLSLLTDGAIMMSSDIASWRGDADDRYRRFFDLAVRQRDAQLKNPGYASSKIEHFPAGDGGYVFHRVTKAVGANGARTDTEAVFRSGEDLMWVALWGNVHRAAKDGERVPADPLTEEVTYGEISDIVKSLSGDGQPGEPRITKPELAQHPTLAATKANPVAGGTTTGDVCGKFDAAAGRLGVAPVPKRGGCAYDPPEGASYGEGSVHRTVEIAVGVEEEDSNTPAEEELARELRSLLGRTSDGTYTFGKVYDLPVGDTGYAVYYTVKGGGGSSSGYVQAGYAVDGTTHVLVKLAGRVKKGRDLVAPSEEALVADLVTVLTAMGG